MTALTFPAASGLSETDRPTRPHVMGMGLPPALRTVGALAALLAAVALTGLVLVGLAAMLPLALIVAVASRRAPPRGERSGWRPAVA